MDLVRKLYAKFVLGKQKMIVAFVVPIIVGGLATAFGITSEMTVEEAVTIVVAWVITTAGVYLKANTK